MKKIVVGLLILLLVSLQSVALAQEAVTASAELQDTQGNVVGLATLIEGASGVSIAVSVVGLSGASVGEHGIHIHAVGTCAPDFAAAGGHFNPQEAQHGLDNPAGAHAGDNPNMEISADGSGTYNAVNDRITLSAGPNSVFDADGSAIVIHAGPDDQASDPTGNSGDRIVCGVIQQATGGDAAMVDESAMADDAEMADDAAVADDAEMADDAAMADDAEMAETEAAVEPATLPTAGGGYSYTPVLALMAGILLLLGGVGLRQKV